MSNDYDLKDAVTELKAVLKPLETLAEAMRGLDRSHRLQADLQAAEHFYEDHERNNAYKAIQLATAAHDDARDTLLVSSRRGSDQRTFEQYAAAHGNAVAEKAFTTHEDAVARIDKAHSDLSDLRRQYPVLFRISEYVSKS